MMKNSMRQAVMAALLAVAALLPFPAGASEAGLPLDRFPTDKLNDRVALQHGAKLFVNYCLNCHAAAVMRYNRLTDLGLTEEQIRSNLMLAGDKVGELMKIAMSPADAKEWFGATPPDLSLIARARASGGGSGADWLYTYLRSYYRDASRPTGWNNALFPNVGMPHVFWELQGERPTTIEEVMAVKDAASGRVAGFVRVSTTYDRTGVASEKTEQVTGPDAQHGRTIKFGAAQGGRLDAASYDAAVADLVAYLTYMSDPSAHTRTRVGVWVLLFLAIFAAAAWNLNRVYWRDVR